LLFVYFGCSPSHWIEALEQYYDQLREREAYTPEVTTQRMLRLAQETSDIADGTINQLELQRGTIACTMMIVFVVYFIVYGVFYVVLVSYYVSFCDVVILLHYSRIILNFIFHRSAYACLLLISSV
jgi:hypothetical protein